VDARLDCHMTCDGTPWSGTLKCQHLPIKTTGGEQKARTSMLKVWKKTDFE